MPPHYTSLHAQHTHTHTHAMNTCRCAAVRVLSTSFPQGGRGGGGSAFGGGSSAGRRRYPAPRPQRYDKEKFLQANFRFLVSSECRAGQLPICQATLILLPVWFGVGCVLAAQGAFVALSAVCCVWGRSVMCTCTILLALGWSVVVVYIKGHKRQSLRYTVGPGPCFAYTTGGCMPLDALRQLADLFLSVRHGTRDQKRAAGSSLSMVSAALV